MYDSKEIITCPACGKQMKKVNLADMNSSIDICLDGCGGIFFNNYELEKICKNEKNIEEIENLLKDKVFEEVDSSKTRTCPECGIPMLKHFTSEKQTVEIDECYDCGSKFLDYGELQAFINEFPNERERRASFAKHFLKAVSFEKTHIKDDNF